MADYPTGFLVGLRSGVLGNTIVRLFLNRDKYSLINVFDHGDRVNQEVYIKQDASYKKPLVQSDFYGTWKPFYTGDKFYGDEYFDYDESDYAFSEIKISENFIIATSMLKNQPLLQSDIFSWENITNEVTNFKKRNGYPAGYHIKTNNRERFYFYLGRDKKTLFLIYTGSLRSGSIYIKQ
jgi:hypothetical protein